MVDDRPVDPDIVEVRPLHASLSAIALVFVGGVFGTLARYGVEEAIPHGGSQWPAATFGINVVGAFVLGLILESLTRRGRDIAVRQRVRLVAGTGFCGAFTTYSTFALEAVLLVRDGHWTTALWYAASTVILGGLAAWAGIAVSVALGKRSTR